LSKSPVLWASEITLDARSHLASTDPEDIFPEVVQLDDSQPGKVAPARQFLNEILPTGEGGLASLPLLATFWNKSAVLSERHKTSAVHVWLPESVRTSPNNKELIRHPLVISPRDDDGFMLQAIRVDVAGPVSWEDVASPVQTRRTEDLSLDVAEDVGGAL